MKRTAFALALLIGGAALAQTDTAATTAYDGDGMATLAFETEAAGTATAGYAPAASGELVQASNSAPERDARGFAVLSDPAVVPAGWNGIPAGAATGGPELDPATGEPLAADHYPACTRTVTDNCLQAYERGRSAS